MNKPSILGYVPCHYGCEYFDAAIRSAVPYVEKIIVLYSPTPSYGHGTTMQCPDTEEELYRIAINASDKIEWHKITAHSEGQHRGLIYRIAEQGGYDGILTFDADEIFGDLSEILPLCAESRKRHIGFSGYINFWKSFNYACRDGFTPIRYINLHNTDAKGCDVVPATVYHFSTAQRMDIMRYKLEIHGHKDELRVNWLRDIYEAWTPENNFGNVHLVSYIPALWNPVPFDKNTLPEILKAHPNFNKDVIL